jgi:hypothetical protein
LKDRPLLHANVSGSFYAGERNSPGTILRKQFSGRALSEELPNDSQIAILFTARLLVSFY